MAASVIGVQFDMSHILIAFWMILTLALLTSSKRGRR